MSHIRKITTGPDYKNGMHFEVGKPVINYTNTVETIRLASVGVYEVWVKNKKEEVTLWKKIENVPVHIEYHIDY